MEEGVPTLISPGDTNLVGAVVKLRGYDDTYLFVARPVDPEVLEFMRLTDDNITEYRQYASNRLVFQITFTIMYLGLALVLLLAALWIGIALANRFVDPIRNLMIASNRVSEGDLDVQVPVQEGRGDLRDLSSRFNTMTQQLQDAARGAGGSQRDQREAPAVHRGGGGGRLGGHRRARSVRRHHAGQRARLPKCSARDEISARRRSVSARSFRRWRRSSSAPSRRVAARSATRSRSAPGRTTAPIRCS